MIKQNLPGVTIQLPAELVARMEELKKFREQDKERSIEEIIVGMCQSYVKVREMARQEIDDQVRLEKTYHDEPLDCRDDWPIGAYPKDEK